MKNKEKILKVLDTFSKEVIEKLCIVLLEVIYNAVVNYNKECDEKCQ